MADRETVAGTRGHFVLLDGLGTGPTRASVYSERVVGILQVVIEVDHAGYSEILIVLNLDSPGCSSHLILVIEKNRIAS